MASAASAQRDLGRLEGKIDGLMVLVSDTKSDVASLRDDFNTMEKGRLTNLELQFNTLKTEATTKARNTAFYTSIAGSVVASIVSAVLLSLFLNR